MKAKGCDPSSVWLRCSSGRSVRAAGSSRACAGHGQAAEGATGWGLQPYLRMLCFFWFDFRLISVTEMKPFFRKLVLEELARRCTFFACHEIISVYKSQVAFSLQDYFLPNAPCYLHVGCSLGRFPGQQTRAGLGCAGRFCGLTATEQRSYPSNVFG